MRGSQLSTLHSPPPIRLVWIDFLRGLAVLGMIETHAVNSFLAPIYRSGNWFTLLSYVNGWVAPTFLFIAGLLQGLWVRKNWDAPKTLLPKLRHLAVILIIGYALQFPWDALFHLSSGGWQSIYQALGKVDVLHCISISLAGLLVLTRICKNLASYEGLVGVLALAIIVATPFVWKSVEDLAWTHPLVGYLSPVRGALFPLMPWSVFLLAGTLASRWLGHPKVFALLFILTSVVGWICKLGLSEWLQLQTYVTRYDSILFRLATVLLGCAVCSLWRQNPDRLTRAINWCGARSLLLYVWHLILLHSGLGLIPPLRSLFPKTQMPLNVFWLYLLTLSGTLILTFLWPRVIRLLAIKLFGQKA